MNILGINAVYHESAAALLVDGKLVAAVEEERFNRIKHGKEADFDNPHQFPERAIRYCLKQAGLTAADIDHVAFSFDPKSRRKQYRAEWWDPRLEETFRLRMGEVPAVADELFGRSLGQRLHFVSHHLAHAASAYFPSGFDRAAILSIDGIGEVAGSTLAKATGNRIQTIETFDYPHSLGFLWEVFSGYLGFSHYDASKVMGLAAYGNPEVFRGEFQSILRAGKEDYAVDQRALGFQSTKFDRLESLFGPPRWQDAGIERRHADIAAALQEATDAAVTALVRRLKRKVPFDNLCIAGGVALNCVTNEVIRQSGEFSDVFIPSAPHDAGTAIGAALVVHCAKEKKPPQRGYSTPYLGPAFDRRDILAAVKSAGLTPHRSKAPAREAAEMIADGKIVAWFQGRMEFGPRALGNRSLLADPRRPDMRRILNQKVKHREDFRPFAPSVMAELADEWFEVGAHLTSHEFMLFAPQVKAERRDRIPAVLHQDGTARVQLVSEMSNPRFHELLSCFHAQTGVPLVVNTSFNDSEPIVCTPTDAIVTFRKSGIDALFMDDVVLTAQT
ncbi:MAG TPA: carbamoyltransferase C-terminal domain-containing protein [Bradyrhizobium sp.]|uniref:carbamoyltransferase family protein n=1 Tax=Bradyrhizobium sp. TaxID=376 RepID=UPI002CB680A4|nr:carbamoyltransferase C-terminal domain-containing protein [Bradyrhizobium sp.]HLZ04097.1 carbamoyltransferase C-terminal domain-containing protein [Bradyrhizobium sp.]